MRLVIDLQGAQASNRRRGIGRYSLSLAQGLARNRGDNEVFLVLNGCFPDSIEQIHVAFSGLIPRENILVWWPIQPVAAADSSNSDRRLASELLLESVLTSVAPDFILVTSNFEGLVDNAVTTVGRLQRLIPTAVVVYDLIPLIHRDIYLKNPVIATWYYNKLSHLRSADLLFAISESTRREVINYLEARPHEVFNISTAAESYFTPGKADPNSEVRLAKKYGIVRPFVLYTGGIDHRKNIEGLIRAFSKLPPSIRVSHQLAIVCSIEDGDRARLSELAASSGLAKDDLVLTGFVPEEDLLNLYRVAKLFVFPSWHEGFGLPALEAMMCGRAVIASNNSSLPEVVGLDDALFDPHNIDSIAARIEKALIDDKFRAKLERHGRKWSKSFSWDKTASRAWDALESTHESSLHIPSVQKRKRQRLAFISPIPPEASGISDYSAELLPELSRHYNIEIISDVAEVSELSLKANYPIRGLGWFRLHAEQFDRILYHFGNSGFHSYMFDLLRDHPGVIVLHDFYLSSIIAHRDVTEEEPNGWARALMHSHGWKEVQHRFKAQDTADVVWAYPCNLQVLQDALGVIVHGDYSRNLADRWYGDGASSDWRLIPLLRQPIASASRVEARSALGLAETDFVVCSFGMLGRQKLNDRLLDAWIASPLAKDPSCKLVFVGQNDLGEYGKKLEQLIESGTLAGTVHITGRVHAFTFRQWLTSADLGVQLRSLSRGETSAAVLDCMNAKLATIVNANGSMAELPPDSVWMLDDEFTDGDLVSALVSLHMDGERRRHLGESAQSHIAMLHQPRHCADAYAAAIEHYYSQAERKEHGLRQALLAAEPNLTESDWVKLSARIGRALPAHPRLKQIFVDISELVQRDSRSGIQRVVRSILMHWLSKAPAGWGVEPVYAEPNGMGYRYARKFTCAALEIPDLWSENSWGEDDWVEPAAGDVFVGLDLQPAIVIQQLDTLKEWRHLGVRIHFVLYDLLPVIMPEHFFPGARLDHSAWLSAIALFDGVSCISRSAADEFHDWLIHHGPKRQVPLEIRWFHLGGDAVNVPKNPELSEYETGIIGQLALNPSFLAVGTIEPRKGYRQVLAAFESLWASEIVVNLVIVGKLGWMMEDFEAQLRDHPQAGVCLFWLEAISDEFLNGIYSTCRCLLVASEGEGFGLPLIEAARQGLPILARDIPVFREVAGDGAAYFADRKESGVISEAIKSWLKRGSKNPPAEKVRCQTWAESADALMDNVMERGPPLLLWRPDSAFRIWGGDLSEVSRVGMVRRRHLWTSGEQGFLLDGAQLPLKAGTYRVKLSGRKGHLTGTERAVIVSSDSNEPLLNLDLAGNGRTWLGKGLLVVDHENIEPQIRVWVDYTSDLSLESVEIIPIDE